MKKLILSLALGGAVYLGASADALAAFRVIYEDGSSKTLETPRTPAATPSEDLKTQEVLQRALGVLGTPYRWGGSSAKRGFDCSGLVKYAFDDVDDLDLPRTSRELSRFDGPRVDRKNLQPGDLLFFRIRGRTVDHVAIYLGDGRFIHAPRKGSRVRIDRLNNHYWQKHFQLARRVMPDADTTQLANNG